MITFRESAVGASAQAIGFRRSLLSCAAEQEAFLCRLCRIGPVKGSERIMQNCIVRK